MHRRFLGIPTAEEFSRRKPEGFDGEYTVIRQRPWESLARSLLGAKYLGGLRLGVNLGGSTLFTDTRGATIYKVEEGEVTAKVDLPLIAIGKLGSNIIRTRNNPSS
ncbi:MAG: hypothetical protein UY22_C0048G0012 [Candidatus Amesbacteria bacterium GW2011_GWC1_48_10]|uniref:Uncharacterized protein n=1 Tax=Candidatus Amesbacteria bacterium GW2011_GWC1_48_10 TaxID=1618365 RepID=A0A0G1X942_9BACT|nr:MAG: hypothetical protein UY22_C0048G0012 [Candidatus Amesbacteria bacterium GW2011_GWC1_48_10]